MPNWVTRLTASTTAFRVSPIMCEITFEINLDDINRVIKKHLQADNVRIAVVTKDAEAFKQAALRQAFAHQLHVNARKRDPGRGQDHRELQAEL